MAKELPFQFSRRWKELVDQSDPRQVELMDAHETNYRDLEDYLANLSTTSAGATGSTFYGQNNFTSTVTSGETENVSLILGPFDTDVTIMVWAQVAVLFGTDNVVQHIELRTTKDGTPFGWNAPQYQVNIGASGGDSMSITAIAIGQTTMAAAGGTIGVDIHNSSAYNWQRTGVELSGIILAS